jgi:hypothetical protein
MTVADANKLLVEFKHLGLKVNVYPGFFFMNGTATFSHGSFRGNNSDPKEVREFLKYFKGY